MPQLIGRNCDSHAAVLTRGANRLNLLADQLPNPTVVARAIIRDIVAGERDPKALASRRDRRVKASAEEIVKTLTGNWREEHLFVLRQAQR